MAETIMHNLRAAAETAKNTDRSGNWPISPRIRDSKLMEQYVKYLAETGDTDALHRYGELNEQLETLGIALPSLESGG